MSEQKFKERKAAAPKPPERAPVPPFNIPPVSIRVVHLGGTQKIISFLGVAMGRAYVMWSVGPSLLVKSNGEFEKKSCRLWRIHPDDMPMLRKAVKKDKLRSKKKKKD